MISESPFKSPAIYPGQEAPIVIVSMIGIKLYPVIVKVNEFSASSIDILVRCFTNTNNYQDYITIKDSFAIEIKSIVEKRNGAFAFPSQSLYIEKQS